MKYIEVNGDSLPVKFGYKVVKKYMAKYKLAAWSDWTQLPAKVGFEDMPGVLLGALQAGAKTTGDECRLTLEGAEDILDTNPHLVTELWDIYMEDMTPASKKEQVQKAMKALENGAVAEEVAEGN